MQSSKYFRSSTDILMTATLLFLMGYQFWGDAAHEWAGVFMVVLFIIHQILNRHWYIGLIKGTYSSYRVFLLLVDALVFLAMIGLAFSGILLSNHVFPFIELPINLSFARLLHMASAYWGFVLMAVHLGCHWNMVLAMGRRALSKRLEPAASDGILSVLAGWIIALYGGFAFFYRDLPSYLFLQTHFVFFDFLEPKFLFYFDYLMIMGAFVFVAHVISALLRKRISLKTGRSQEKPRALFRSE